MSEAKEDTPMRFEIPPLPYPKDALEPHLGAETLDFHYEKHHRGYLEKLKKLIGSTPLVEHELEEIIATADGAVFNNAAQVWNHNFYWKCMKPRGGGDPPKALRADLERCFGSLDKFKQKVADTAVAQFGSGYVWLYSTFDGRLAVRSTHDAMNPLLDGVMPLLTIDLWEHAYYLDYQHEREKYVHAFLDHLANWEFVIEGREALRRGLSRSADEPARAPAGSP
jgi:superoxide dismutase, Fe-Mn family